MVCLTVALAFKRITTRVTGKVFGGNGLRIVWKRFANESGIRHGEVAGFVVRVTGTPIHAMAHFMNVHDCRRKLALKANATVRQTMLRSNLTN
jgi:hypothetical protein